MWRIQRLRQALPSPKTRAQERADEALKAITLHLRVAGIGVDGEQSPGEATHEAISKVVAQAFERQVRQRGRRLW